MAEKTATVDSAPWFDDESMAKSYPIGEQVTGLQAERLVSPLAGISSSAVWANAYHRSLD